MFNEVTLPEQSSGRLERLPGYPLQLGNLGDEAIICVKLVWWKRRSRALILIDVLQKTTFSIRVAC